MFEFFQNILDFIGEVFSVIGSAVQVVFNLFSVVGNFFSGLFGVVGFSPLVIYLSAAFGLLLVAAIVILIIRLL